MKRDHPRRLGADVDAAPLRRVRWRLAALTVGLLFALLLALGAVVYGTAQHTFMDSLQSNVKDRANAALPRLIRGLDHFPFGPGSGCATSGDAFLIVADPNLNVAGSCPGGQTLPDPAAAQQALQGQATSLFSTQQVDGDGPYLVYTAQVSRPDDGTVIGVVQAYLSEQQYQESLHSLLMVLLAVSGVGLLASAAISAIVVRRALQPVQVAMRRQRDFVADAAHELRTPLAIIRTAAELGMANGTQTEQQTALEQTLAQNAHLTHLVDSLSLLARADSGVVTLERQPVDLGRLISETVSGVEILAEERDVRLQVAVGGSIQVLGDAGRLRQLLLILLDNALKYTPDGGAIMVSVERGGGRARLTVRDSGPGIDPRDLPHLFDRFYRADRARSTDGMGLGLAIGRWIAEAHGGRIAAANAPGGGAVFTVTLPLAPQ